MVKKRTIEGNFYDGYSLLGIVCGLPDFRATHFINQYAGFNFKKFKNFSLSQENESSFSWYYSSREELRHNYFLIKNKEKAEILLPGLHNFDYLLLIEGNITSHYFNGLLTSLRKTPHITAIFEQDLKKLKNSALLIERNELHALKQMKQ